MKNFSTQQPFNVVNACLMLAYQQNNWCISCYESKFPLQGKVLKTMTWGIIKCYCWEYFKSPWWKFRNTHVYITIFKYSDYRNIFEWPQLIDLFPVVPILIWTLTMLTNYFLKHVQQNILGHMQTVLSGKIPTKQVTNKV